MEQQQPDRFKEALSLALRRLAVREYGAAEMESYLKRKGYEPKETADVVAELVKSEVLSEQRYVRAMTRSLAIQDKGPLQILGSLRRKGLDINIQEVRSIYSEVSDRSEFDSAKLLLDRRFPRAHADPRERRRAFQALLRRGFAPTVIQACLADQPEDGPSN